MNRCTSDLCFITLFFWIRRISSTNTQVIGSVKEEFCSNSSIDEDGIWGGLETSSMALDCNALSCDLESEWAEFNLNNSDKEAIARAFSLAFNQGSQRKDMFIDTHVRIPLELESQTNHQKKEALVVDIGGTFLKICLMEVRKSGEYKFIKDTVKYPISKEGLEDTIVWDWVSQTIEQFLDSDSRGRSYEGAITLSYPVLHKTMGSGIVLGCGKNFPFSKVRMVDSDPVVEMNKACKKRKLSITFKVVLNDATATVLSSYFKDRRTMLGIVLGTGTNGAIIVPNYEEGNLKIVNSEWGSFEHETIRMTRFDKEVMNRMREQGIKFNNLDVLIGGYKFVELVQNACASKGIEDCENLKLEHLCTLLEKDACDFEVLSKSEREIVHCIKSIKKRTSSVLAALILGVMKGLPLRNEISVCLNGSVFENKLDTESLEEEMSSLLKHVGLDETIKIKWDFIAEASLVGCAFSLLLGDD